MRRRKLTMKKDNLIAKYENKAILRIVNSYIPEFCDFKTRAAYNSLYINPVSGDLEEYSLIIGATDIPNLVLCQLLFDLAKVLEKNKSFDSQIKKVKMIICNFQISNEECVFIKKKRKTVTLHVHPRLAARALSDSREDEEYICKWIKKALIQAVKK